MAKESIKRWIYLAVTVLVITGGYLTYNMVFNRLGSGSGWAPAGRGYEVHRSNLPIAVSGTGTVTNLAGANVIISVKQSDIQKVRTGNQARVWIKDLSSTFEGSVVSSSDKPRIINNQTFYDVTISLKDSTKIKKGMVADGQIILDSKENVIVVPSLAVFTRDNGSKYVWVIPPKWNGDTNGRVRATLREVKTGYMDDRNTEIAEGLQEGEKVVLPSSQD